MIRNAMVPALALLLCACEQERRTAVAPADKAPAAAAAQSDRPDSDASESVMRPSVLAEAEPEASPAPPPPPARAVLLFSDQAIGLGADAEGTLDALLTPERLAGTSMVIVSGHSDSRGSDRQNKAASQRRAEAVRDYLVGKGVAVERIRVVALGEARPVAPNALPDGSDDPAGRARNRRVEVEFARAAPAGRSTEPPATN